MKKARNACARARCATEVACTTLADAVVGDKEPVDLNYENYVTAEACQNFWGEPKAKGYPP